jgi:hypothetical protein
VDVIGPCIQKYDCDFITPYCHKKSLHDKITEEGSIYNAAVGAMGFVGLRCQLPRGERAGLAFRGCAMCMACGSIDGVGGTNRGRTANRPAGGDVRETDESLERRAKQWVPTYDYDRRIGRVNSANQSPALIVRSSVTLMGTAMPSPPLALLLHATC